MPMQLMGSGCMIVVLRLMGMEAPDEFVDDVMYCTALPASICGLRRAC